MSVRRTVVCRNFIPHGKDRVQCRWGGRWGDHLPKRCPRCGGQLTDLAPTYVLNLNTNQGDSHVTSH